MITLIQLLDDYRDACRIAEKAFFEYDHEQTPGTEATLEVTRANQIEAWLKLRDAAMEADLDRRELAALKRAKARQQPALSSIAPGVYGIGMTEAGVDKMRRMLGRVPEDACASCGDACEGDGRESRVGKLCVDCYADYCDHVYDDAREDMEQRCRESRGAW